MKKRVGMYAWAGPGTVRLLQTKYHLPKIDKASFLNLYDRRYWKKAKYLFDVTDAWLTYSWGFSEEHEQVDRQFVTSRLEIFQDLDIQTHAYIQGFNVVYEDFKDQDLFCRTPDGDLLPYSKGRKMTCPNNPLAVKVILDRVEKACAEKFSGIYIDNIIFGLPPIFVSQNFVPFFGCACQFCQEKFKREYGYELPVTGLDQKALKDYLASRADSVEHVIAQAHALTQKFGKEFGINLYDPFLHTPELYFGYNLAKIDKYLSYYLIENHAHPTHSAEGNSHLGKFIEQAKKPVFIVSYKNGIGFDEQFRQTDIDVIFAESEQLHYSPCLKATEFTTYGIWHALKLEEYVKPKQMKLEIKMAKIGAEKLAIASGWQIWRAKILQKYGPKVLTLIYENRFLDFWVRKSGLFQKQLWSVKIYDL